MTPSGEYKLKLFNNADAAVNCVILSKHFDIDMDVCYYSFLVQKRGTGRKGAGGVCPSPPFSVSQIVTRVVDDSLEITTGPPDFLTFRRLWTNNEKVTTKSCPTTK